MLRVMGKKEGKSCRAVTSREMTPREAGRRRSMEEKREWGMPARAGQAMRAAARMMAMRGGMKRARSVRGMGRRRNSVVSAERRSVIAPGRGWEAYRSAGASRVGRVDMRGSIA
jgi:hypothetical protein